MWNSLLRISNSNSPVPVREAEVLHRMWTARGKLRLEPQFLLDHGQVLSPSWQPELLLKQAMKEFLEDRNHWSLTCGGAQLSLSVSNGPVWVSAESWKLQCFAKGVVCIFRAGAVWERLWQGRAFLAVVIAWTFFFFWNRFSCSLGLPKLTMYSRLTLNSWFLSLYLLNAEFTIVSHRSQF